MSSMAPTGTGNALRIQTFEVAKRYGPLLALQRCSLHLEGAGIWALVGPNGAGKSTLLRLLAGQIKPSLGKVRIGDASPYRNAAVARQLGWSPSADALYDEATAHEFVAWLARWSGMPAAQADTSSMEVLTALGLQAVLHRPLRQLSRGMRQRVKLAQALVHRPSIVLLDEPFSALDAQARQHVVERLRQHAAAGALIVLSTHLLEEAAQLSDRLLMMVGGRLVAQGTLAELQRRLDEQSGRLHVSCDQPRRLAQALLTATNIRAVRLLDESQLEIEAVDLRSAYATLTQTLLSEPYGLRSITSPDANLSSTFHRLLKAQQRQGQVA